MSRDHTPERLREMGLEKTANLIEVDIALRVHGQGADHAAAVAELLARIEEQDKLFHEWRLEMMRALGMADSSPDVIAAAAKHTKQRAVEAEAALAAFKEKTYDEVAKMQEDATALEAKLAAAERERDALDWESMFHNGLWWCAVNCIPQVQLARYRAELDQIEAQ